MNSLSICIPSNRNFKCLKKCLDSIKNASKPKDLKFDICISDNSGDISKIRLIRNYKKKIDIKYQFVKRKTNRVENLCNSIKLSKNDFTWFIGDDEVVSKKCFINIEKIFQKKSKNIDLIFLNSNFIKKNQKLNFLSTIKKFHDLIDYRISDDYMIAMFLSIFRRSAWEKHKSILNKFKKDNTEFSKLENTFPHSMVFSKAFMNSNIYFSKKIYTNNFIKHREWSDLWPLVQSIRMPQMLDYYRKCGLPIKKYIINKNYSLRFFLPHAIKILLGIKSYPISFFELLKCIICNAIYPYYYLSPAIWSVKRLQKK